MDSHKPKHKRRLCISVDEEVARVMERDARRQHRSLSNYVAFLALSNRALSETDSRLAVAVADLPEDVAS